MHRVFLGAPSKGEIDNDPSSYQWHTVSSRSHVALAPSQSVILPAATLEAAGARISLIYRNAIFDKSFGEEEYDADNHEDFSITNPPGGADQTTVITWPPTPLDSIQNLDRSNPSFHSNDESAFISRVETQQDESQSYNYSDMSSIARFPSFHFSLNRLSSLSDIRNTGKMNMWTPIMVLLVVLEVEGPDTIRIKKGKDAGKEVSLLKLIGGEESGAVCKIVAWREVADAWSEEGMKRGDVVLIENVTASCEPNTSPVLTASPNLKSAMTVCYRTMPYTHEDQRLRPDLRLAQSDASVRKVAQLVHWFENMAGLGSTE